MTVVQDSFIEGSGTYRLPPADLSKVCGACRFFNDGKCLLDDVSVAVDYTCVRFRRPPDRLHKLGWLVTLLTSLLSIVVFVLLLAGRL